MIKEIEIIARGVIRHDDKILLCRAKNKKNWYFPGGHVDVGETGKEALKREIREEIGRDVEVGKLLGVSENFYNDGNDDHQEMNLVFEAELLNKEVEVECCEDHLEFSWIDESDLERAYVLPEGLKKAVLKQTVEGRVFHIEER